MPRIFNGQEYYGIREAAKRLRTNIKEVRSLMGNGSLDYYQPRVNAPIYICKKSCEKLLYKRVMSDKK